MASAVVVRTILLSQHPFCIDSSCEISIHVCIMLTLMIQLFGLMFKTWGKMIVFFPPRKDCCKFCWWEPEERRSPSFGIFSCILCRISPWWEPVKKIPMTFSWTGSSVWSIWWESAQDKLSSSDLPYAFSSVPKGPHFIGHTSDLGWKSMKDLKRLLSIQVYIWKEILNPSQE